MSDTVNYNKVEKVQHSTVDVWIFIIIKTEEILNHLNRRRIKIIKSFSQSTIDIVGNILNFHSCKESFILWTIKKFTKTTFSPIFFLSLFFLFKQNLKNPLDIKLKSSILYIFVIWKVQVLLNYFLYLFPIYLKGDI